MDGRMTLKSVCAFRAVKSESISVVDNEINTVLGSDTIGSFTVTKCLRLADFHPRTANAGKPVSSEIIDQFPAFTSSNLVSRVRSSTQTTITATVLGPFNLTIGRSFFRGPVTFSSERSPFQTAMGAGFPDLAVGQSNHSLNQSMIWRLILCL
jgi:hypothetical protein